QQQRRGDRDRPDQAARHSGCGDGEHDALDRGHDLAPEPGRQRRGQPRDQQARQQEHVAGGADGQDPGAVVLGHHDAEQQDEEGVDFAVDAGAQRGDGTGPARHLPVHGVEDQRDGGQGDQRRDRHWPAERVSDQARDRGDQQRTDQSYPVRRVYRRLVAARAGGNKQRGRRRTDDQASDPADGVEASGGRHDAERGGGGEHPQEHRDPDPGDRYFAWGPNLRRLNRLHRTSVCVPYAVVPLVGRRHTGTTDPKVTLACPRGRLIDLFARLARITGVTSLHSVPAGVGSAVRRFGPLSLRLAAGVTVLWFLGRELGAAPFEDGLRAVTWQGVAATVTLTVLTTICSAWRWQVMARALGTDISLSRATGAYYRSLFLNSVLPGGILGDVHRAVTQGRRGGDVARGVRAVGWERLCGQVIQAVVTAVVLLTLPSPVRPALPYVLAGIAVVVGCTALVVSVAPRLGRSRPARATRVIATDLRRGLLVRGVWPRLTLASMLVVAGHTATFVAARIAGATAPLGELIALLMVIQIAAGIPLNIGGWGPREGAAAWVFAAAGLGAATGVTVSTLYAVLMLVAVTPG